LETQRASPITNVRTADKPWTNEWEIISCKRLFQDL
jgi:hypothetical protein